MAKCCCFCSRVPSAETKSHNVESQDKLGMMAGVCLVTILHVVIDKLRSVSFNENDDSEIKGVVLFKGVADLYNVTGANPCNYFSYLCKIWNC